MGDQEIQRKLFFPLDGIDAQRKEDCSLLKTMNRQGPIGTSGRGLDELMGSSFWVTKESAFRNLTPSLPLSFRSGCVGLHELAR